MTLLDLQLISIHHTGINDNIQGDFGDVSDRTELRKNLQCHSFGWYISNIYPELFVPGEAVASGEVRNLGGGGSSMCLDSPAHKPDLHKAVSLYPCHNQGGNQYWLLSKEGEIRRDEACLDYSGKDVILYYTRATDQEEINYGFMIHLLNKLSMEVLESALKCLQSIGIHLL